MTLAELNDFAAKNNIPKEAQICVETGIDIFVALESAIYDGVTLNLIQEHFDENTNV